MSELITLAIERRWTKKYFKIKTPVLVHLRWGSFFILHFKHLGFSTETSLEDSIKSINADILGLKFILYESVWHFKIYFSLYGSCVKYGSNWMPHSIVLITSVLTFGEYSSIDSCPRVYSFGKYFGGRTLPKWSTLYLENCWNFLYENS